MVYKFKILLILNTLVFAITKHFVGDPTDYRESAYENEISFSMFISLVIGGMIKGKVIS